MMALTGIGRRYVESESSLMSKRKYTTSLLRRLRSTTVSFPVIRLIIWCYPVHSALCHLLDAADWSLNRLQAAIINQ